MLDYTNKRFGNLVALRKEKRGKILGWICKCDCGKEKWIETYSLTRGVKSCGCRATKALNEARKNFQKKDIKEGTSLISMQRNLNSNNSSGIKGVAWSPAQKYWIAYLTLKGHKFQKSFKEKEDAIKYRKYLEEKYFEPILKKHAKIKKCKVCGKEFESKNSLHLYCSKECKIKQNVLDSAKYRRDYSKKYQDKNREKISNYNKQRYKTLDKEKVKKHNHDYYIKNKDKIREKYQEYRLSYYKSHYIKKSKNS